jgi:hypothetical protein
MAKKVVHVNIMDDNNEVYCRLRKKVVVLDEEQQRDFCGHCPMFHGSAQGRGVECEWEDVRDIPSPYMVTRPSTEKDHIVTAEAKANK